jgi:AraC-like DNA-binding protein
MSVVDYVQREKIDEARFLLEHTDLGLSQISSHLNYSSQSYFIAQFKKIVGETPERYRNKKQHL